jgi:hypothetical protein
MLCDADAEEYSYLIEMMPFDVEVEKSLSHEDAAERTKTQGGISCASLVPPCQALLTLDFGVFGGDRQGYSERSQLLPISRGAANWLPVAKCSMAGCNDIMHSYRAGDVIMAMVI